MEKEKEGVHGLSLMSVTPEAAPVKVNIAEVFDFINDNLTRFAEKGVSEILLLVLVPSECESLEAPI